MSAEQEREDCHKIVEEAATTFCLLAHERYTEFTYELDAFKEPERDDYMGLFKGTEGAKEFYQTLLKFWVYTFFGFLENHGWQEKFDLQARGAWPSSRKGVLDGWPNAVAWADHTICMSSFILGASSAASSFGARNTRLISATKPQNRERSWGSRPNSTMSLSIRLRRRVR
jgi:hypothetical protein